MTGALTVLVLAAMLTTIAMAVSVRRLTREPLTEPADRYPTPLQPSEHDIERHARKFVAQVERYVHSRNT